MINVHTRCNNLKSLLRRFYAYSNLCVAANSFLGMKTEVKISSGWLKSNEECRIIIGNLFDDTIEMNHRRMSECWTEKKGLRQHETRKKSRPDEMWFAERSRARGISIGKCWKMMRNSKGASHASFKAIDCATIFGNVWDLYKLQHFASARLTPKTTFANGIFSCASISLHSLVPERSFTSAD